jgi:hypothetical protein
LTNIAYYDIKARRILKDHERESVGNDGLRLLQFMPQTAKNSSTTEVIWLFSHIAESSATWDFRRGRNVDR